MLSFDPPARASEQAAWFSMAPRSDETQGHILMQKSNSRSGLNIGSLPEGNRRSWTPKLLDSLTGIYENNTGLLLIAFAQLFGCLMNIAVKFLNTLEPPLPVLELVAIRMFFTYIVATAYMLYHKIPYPIYGPPGVRMLLTTRGISGFIGLWGLYYPLQYLSLSDTTVLTFLIPSVTAFTGYYLMGEKFSRGEAVSCVCGLIGVIFIARPTSLFGAESTAAIEAIPGHDFNLNLPPPPSEQGTPAERLGAVGVALLGVLGGTAGFTSSRQIGSSAHPLHHVTFFSSMSVLASIIGILIFRVPIVVPEGVEFMELLFATVIFGLVSKLLVVLGFQRETASRGSLGVYAQIIFAVGLERIFFSVTPSATSLIGGLIIVGSALFVAMTKQSDEKFDRSYLADDGLGDLGKEELMAGTHEDRSHSA